MKRIGLTGGIGSGKTTVANMFEQLGVHVYNADNMAKKLMRSDKQLKSKIKELLGDQSYHKNGYPNRPYIANLVFKNKELLSELNHIVHPAVKQDLKNWFQSHLSNAYTIYESAIILDHNTEDQFDIIISVVAPIDIKIERLLQRDKTTEEAIQKRMSNQITDKARIKRSDYIIYNGATDQLIPQVYKLHQLLNR